MTYSCRVTLFGQELEHHILIGAPTSSLGVGRHRHVQLGSAAMAWCSKNSGNTNLRGCAYLLQIWMWERFPVARSYHHESQVCTQLLIFITHILC
jgi:hypothetical protein